MRRVTSFGFWCIVVLTLLIANPMLAIAAQQNQTSQPSDEENGQIDSWRIQARLSPSVFGPESGTIAQDTEIFNVVRGHVEVRDFYARATFTNPQAASEHAFDYGFVFRIGRDANFGIGVDSRGSWFFDYGGSTLASDSLSNLNVDAGGTNLLELAVVGGDAYLAVNNVQVASVDVSNRVIPGDVAIATAFATQTTNHGAETPFSGYQIWSLDALTANQATTVDPAGEQLLEQARAASDLAQPIVGPTAFSVSASADEEGFQSIPADIDVTDFYMKLSALVPANAATQSWDIGIGFRDKGDNDQYRLTIASNGTYYVSQGTSAALQAGSFTGLNTAPQSANDIELAVSGTTGALAINGEAVAIFDLSIDQESGDIWLATGIYRSDIGDATTVIDVSNVTIWELGALTVTPEPTATISTNQVTDDAAKFQQLMNTAQTNAPIAEIASGEIKQDAQTLYITTAGVDVQNFATRATFTNPYATTEADWDYGFEFRLKSSTHYRLYVTSSGSWFFRLSTSDAIAEGVLDNLDTSANGSNTLELAVDGNTGYFSVNGKFIAALDTSQHQERGDVGVSTAFLEGNFIPNGATPFSDFVVWSLDNSLIESPTPEATTAPPLETPTPIATEVAPTPESSPVSENSYISPTYGFTISWNDDWQKVGDSSQDGTDALRLDNGISTVDLYGYPTQDSPGRCVDSEFNIFQTTQGYSNAEIAIDTSGNELRGDEAGFSWGIFNFTYTDEQNTATDYTAYVECRPIEDGASMILFVQFAEADQFENQTAARDELLARLSMAGEEPIPTPVITPEPTTEIVTTPVVSGQSITIQLEAFDNSNISGLAMLTANGDQTNIQILTIGAEAGTTVLLQQGTCGNLSPVPAQLLPPTDATGSSSRTIPMSLGELRGYYSIALHTSLDDLTHPAACGPIPAP